MKTSHIQSIVGVGTLDTGLLQTRKLSRPDVIAFNEKTYLVGEHTSQYARTIERLDFSRLGDGPELKALTYATWGNLLGGGVKNISVMVGLPIEVMNNKTVALSIRRELRRWMVGKLVKGRPSVTHLFSLNGTMSSVTVEKVNVMSQPSGTYCAWALNNAGGSAINEYRRRATVAICDIGFNTLDLFVRKANGEISPIHTRGDTLGMRRAAETLQEHVRRNHGVKLNLHQADALMRSKKPELETRDGFIDVTPEVEQARGIASAGVIQFLTTTWESLNASVILFTGGGAEALRSELLRHYPTGRVLPEPIMANALGLARYMRMKGFSGDVVGLDPGFGGFKGVLL